MFQLTLWSIVPLTSALLALVAYARARKRLHVPGGSALRFLFLALFCWSAPQALETILTDPTAKLIASKAAYLGIVFVPVAWFQFAMTFGQRVLHASRPLMTLVSLVPCITLVLLFTNPWHNLVWTSWTITQSGAYLGLTVSYGPWFYINAFYAYALVLIATTILMFTLAQFKLPRTAVLAALFAPLLGVIANLYYLSSFNQTPWFDPTTAAFLVGILLLDRGVLRVSLMNKLPVVRDRVVEELTDPILVINHDGKILDANQSTLNLWKRERESVLGSPVTDLVAHLPLDTLLNSDLTSEATINNRYFEVATTPMDASNPNTDVVLVLRDITERRNSEQKLRELKDELERMAHTDALTNLFNRRYFMQRLNEEFERIQRHSSTLSVLIFDLDYFKRINDNYGHDVGDLVLVSVSNVTDQVKRVTDVACRLGGEEFALLLPETDKTGALKMAHRLRRGIEEYPYLDLVGHPLKVTASVGVATVTTQSKAPETVLKVADRALYKAKNGGRNMVCYDEG